MNKSIQGILALGLLAALSGPVPADDLYIRNRPFKGVTASQEGQLWVELEPFAQALKADLKQTSSGGYILSLEGDPSGDAPTQTLMVGGAEVPLREVNGAVLAPLETVARLLNARVVANRDLKTIDVNLTTEGKSVAGAWGNSTVNEPAKVKEVKAPPIPKATLRLYGKVTLEGADQVGLFKNGSANTPYKVGKVDKNGNYSLDIDLEKDLHEFDRGVFITDIRFFKDGAFEMCHGRCNFLYYMPASKKMVLEPYETGQRLDISSNNYEFNEQY